MQKTSSLPGKWLAIFFFPTALLVLAVDQLTKFWIMSNLKEGQSLPITGWVELTHVRNTGSAFGLFQDQTLPLTIVAILGVVILLFLALFAHRWLPFLNSTSNKVLPFSSGFLATNSCGHTSSTLKRLENSISCHKSDFASPGALICWCQN